MPMKHAQVKESDALEASISCSARWNCTTEARKGKNMKRKGHSLKRPAGVSRTDHVRGSPMATVTLIGYGDFANPACAATYRAVKKIQKKMGSRIRYIFRSFPQPAQFERSEDAAEAAECASSQGKFWEMHDRLFENGGASDELHLSRYATDLGLNLLRFRREMREHIHLKRIRAGRKAAVRRGVTSAPTFFINAERHCSSFGASTLLPAVQAAAGE
jgi:protein-disulfide isomerase